MVILGCKSREGGMGDKTDFCKPRFWLLIKPGTGFRRPRSLWLPFHETSGSLRRAMST